MPIIQWVEVISDLNEDDVNLRELIPVVRVLRLFGRNPVFSLLVVLLLLQANYMVASFQTVRVITRVLPVVSNPTADSKATYRFRIPFDDNLYHKDFSISFDFQNLKSSGGNLFQTDSEGSGIRIEQILDNQQNQLKSRLLVQYRAWNEEKVIESTKSFDPLTRNSFNLRLDVRNHLMISVNEIKFIDTHIDKQDIRYRDFILGAGLSGSRVFPGVISNAKLELKLKNRETLLSVEVLSVLLLGSSVWYVLRLSKLRSLVQVGWFIATCISVLALNSRLKFAEFFGDDFLNIWPVRRTDVLTIFTEALGPYYRPLTQLAHLLRWDLHGYDVLGWRLGNLLSTVIVAALHFALYSKSLNVSLGRVFLLTLLTFTSPIYFGGAFWWASIGSQHLLSIGLTVCLAISLVRVLSSAGDSSDLRYPVFWLFLLSLTSELFMPLFFLIPGLILAYEFLRTRRVSAANLMTEKTSDGGQMVGANIVSGQARGLTVNLSSLLTFLVLSSVLLCSRYLIVRVPTAVAATSAVNYRFDSISVDSFSNPLQYGLSVFNVFISDQVFDIAAGNGHMLKFSEMGFTSQVLALISLIMFAIIAQNLLSARLQVCKPIDGAATKWGESEMGAFFVLIACLSIVAPSLVPNYLQLRWIQFGFLFGIVGVVLLLRTRNRMQRRIAVGMATVLILSNLLSLRANFGFHFS